MAPSVKSRVKPRVVVIIQARMSSRRLPGKVLLPLAGMPVLWHVVTRSRRIRGVDEVVVATSTDPSDDVIEKWCEDNSVECFRGSLSDVLGRYLACAEAYSADVVVRITADCPFIDPETSSEVLGRFLEHRPALAALSGDFPDGLDTQVFDYAALARANQEASLPSEREHVGPYIEKNPAKFSFLKVSLFSGLHDVRLTLDELADYELLCAVADSLPNKVSGISDILSFLSQRPDLLRVNAGILRNDGYLQSIQREAEGGWVVSEVPEILN